ncbi:MAG: hypothetical protein LBC18_10735 [Opitutaceae bacterium]|nr:hypothetical protein [Opitutaceae bacterium]
MRGGQDADVSQAGAGGAAGEFGKGAGARVGGVDLRGGAEEAGELEGFAAGAGAGVEGMADGGMRIAECGRHRAGGVADAGGFGIWNFGIWNFFGIWDLGFGIFAGTGTGDNREGDGKDELRAEVLDFDEAALAGAGFGDVGVGSEDFERAGEFGGKAAWPAEGAEFGEHGRGVVGLQAEPERGAGVEGVEIGLGKRLRAMAAEPRGQQAGGIEAEKRGAGTGRRGGGRRGGEKGAFERERGGGIGGEPEECMERARGGRGGGGPEGGGGAEGVFKPRQVADGGVEEFAIEAAVAAAEAAFAGEALPDARGEIAVGAEVRAQLIEEREKDAGLIMGGLGQGN